MPNAESLPRCRISATCRVVALVIAWTLAGRAARAGEPRAVPWKTGVEFERALRASVAITWGANPLRDALGSLSRAQGVAIFLDRRVDPDQEIHFSVPDTPVREVLERLAESLGLGTCRVGPVVYVGPKKTAVLLSFLTTQAQQSLQPLPASARSRLARPQAVRWPELATPRQLLEQWAGEAKLEVRELERLPHDLWPAANLPPLDFAQRLSLLLAGFELTFEFADARTIRLIPWPENTSLERRYIVPAQQQAAFEELTRQFPQTRVAQGDGKTVVVGPVEVHELLENLLQGRRTPEHANAKPPRQGDVRWSMRIENKPAGAVVKTVAERLERQLEYDPTLRPRLEKLVSLEVRDATLEDLLEKTLAPVGLSYRLDGKTLRIVPANDPPLP